MKAAEVLVKNGMEVTIVEGRNRIGGRVSMGNLYGWRNDADVEQIYQNSDLGHDVDL